MLSAIDVCTSQILYYLTNKSTADKIREAITDVRSSDNNFYICETGHIKMKKSQVPCQAVYRRYSRGKLFVDDIPEEISCLNQNYFQYVRDFYSKKY